MGEEKFSSKPTPCLTLSSSFRRVTSFGSLCPRPARRGCEVLRPGGPARRGGEAIAATPRGQKCPPSGTNARPTRPSIPGPCSCQRLPQHPRLGRSRRRHDRTAACECAWVGPRLPCRRKPRGRISAGERPSCGLDDGCTGALLGLAGQSPREGRWCRATFWTVQRVSVADIAVLSHVSAGCGDRIADEPEFDGFIVRRSQALLCTAYPLVLDEGLAEYLLQTALTKAWFAIERPDDLVLAPDDSRWIAVASPQCCQGFGMP